MRTSPTLVLTPIQAHVRAARQPRTQPVIQGLSQLHIPTVVHLHALLSIPIPFKARHPKTMPLVRDLMTQPKPRRNIIKLVRRELELPANHRKQIHLLIRRRRPQPGQHELPVQMLHIILFTIISHKHIALIKKTPRLLNHTLMPTRLPIRPEPSLRILIPLSRERQHAPILDNLIQPNILIPQPPHVGDRRRRLDIQRQHLGANTVNRPGPSGPERSIHLLMQVTQHSSTPPSCAPPASRPPPRIRRPEASALSQPSSRQHRPALHEATQHPQNPARR